MMSQPYVHGITETLTHHIASSLTAGHIARREHATLSVLLPSSRTWTSAPAAGGVISDPEMK